MEAELRDVCVRHCFAGLQSQGWLSFLRTYRRVHRYPLVIQIS